MELIGCYSKANLQVDYTSADLEYMHDMFSPKHKALHLCIYVEEAWYHLEFKLTLTMACIDAINCYWVKIHWMLIVFPHKEYKFHLGSEGHKQQLNRLARKHSVVLRKIRVQQRQEQKEIEAKWREENGEEFKSAVTRY